MDLDSQLEAQQAELEAKTNGKKPRLPLEMDQQNGWTVWKIRTEDLIKGLVDKGKTGATMSLAGRITYATKSGKIIRFKLGHSYQGVYRLTQEA